MTPPPLRPVVRALVGASTSLLAAFSVALLVLSAALWAQVPADAAGNPFVWLALACVPLITFAGTGAALLPPAAAPAPPPTTDKPRLQLLDLQDGLVLCSSDGTILAANQSLERTFGTSQSDLVGQSIRVLLPGLGTTSGVPRWRRSSRGEQLGHAWYMDARHTDGGDFRVEATWYHVEEDGRHYVLYGIRDVSEEMSAVDIAEKLALDVAKLTEEAATARRARSAMFSTISHELLTPLNAIIGYSELIASDLPEGDQAFLDIHRVLDSGHRLHAQFRAMLDLGRVEEGKETAFLEWFRVDELVREVCAAKEPFAATRGNTLQVDVGVRLHTHLDRAKLAYSIEVLLDNAIRGTERGTVSISVEAQTETSSIAIRVRDTGEGIPLVHRHLVFDVFPELGATSNRLGGGHSVSLALSREYAILVGGDLTLDDVEEGCGFLLTLPIDATLQVEALEEADDELSEGHGNEGVLLFSTPALGVARGAYAPKRSITGHHAAVPEWSDGAPYPDGSEGELGLPTPRPTIVPDVHGPGHLVASITPTPPPAPPTRRRRAPTLQPKRRRQARRTLVRKLSLPPDTSRWAPARGDGRLGAAAVVGEPCAARDAAIEELAEAGWRVSPCEDAGELMHVAKTERVDIIVADVTHAVPDIYELRRIAYHEKICGVPTVLTSFADPSFAVPVADIIGTAVERSEFTGALARIRAAPGGRMMLLRDCVDGMVTALAQRAGWEVHALDLDDVDSTDPCDLVVVEYLTDQFTGLDDLVELRNLPGWSSVPVMLLAPRVHHEGDSALLRAWLTSDARARPNRPASIARVCRPFAAAPG